MPPSASAMAEVLVGGALGAAAREACEQALTTPAHGFPTTTLAVNLGGAFLLGLLLEALARAGDDTGRRRRARLVLGTGFMGAFTTYSTFAVEADLLVRAGRPLTAVSYVLATVLGGLVATAAGIALPTAGPFGAGRSRAALPVDPDPDPPDPPGLSDPPDPRRLPDPSDPDSRGPLEPPASVDPLEAER